MEGVVGSRVYDIKEAANYRYDLFGIGLFYRSPNFPNYPPPGNRALTALAAEGPPQSNGNPV